MIKLSMIEKEKMIKSLVEEKVQEIILETERKNKIKLLIEGNDLEEIKITKIELVTNESEIMDMLNISQEERDCLAEEYFAFKVSTQKERYSLIIKTNMERVELKCEGVLMVCTAKEKMSVNLDGELVVDEDGAEGDYLTALGRVINEGDLDESVSLIYEYVAAKNYNDISNQLDALRSVMGVAGIGSIKIVGDDFSLVEMKLSGLKIVQNGRELIETLKRMNKS